MNFKLFLTTTLLTCATIAPLQADPIDYAQAAQLASRYVQLSPIHRLRATQAPTKSNVAQPYYIFNDAQRKGFVIISGDDSTSPLLGYANQGQLDPKHLPLPLTQLLQQHQQRIKQRKQMPLTPGVPSPHPKPNAKAVKGPLLTSLWNQSAPFNDLTPRIGTQHTVTGCVATAMAQLMYFHKWPIKGTGSHSYHHYSHNIGELSANFEATTYDWDNMMPHYDYDDPMGFDEGQARPLWNETQAKAVAQLMSDVGIAVNTSYNLAHTRGSASHVGEAAKALGEHFGYHTRTLYRDYSANQDFLATLKAELDQNFPILMVGSQVSSGHAWVIDGYDENGYLHVNWGWGGLSNGYFALSFMSPDKAGIGGEVGGYNQGQVLLLARPNKEGVAPFPALPSGCSYLLPNAGLRFDLANSQIEAQQVGIKIERLGKKQNLGYDAQVAIALRNQQGQQLHLFPYAERLIGQDNNGVYKDLAMRLALPQDLPDGSYSLHTLCKEWQQDDKHWQAVGNDIPLHFTLQAGKIQLPPAQELQAVALRLLERPHLLTPLWKGKTATLQLSIANPTPFATEFGDIVLTWKKGGKTIETPIEQFQFYNHSRYDGLITISSLSPSALETGIYEVDLSFKRPGQTLSITNPFGSFQIEVLEADNKPQLCLAHDYEARNGHGRSFTIYKDDNIWNGEIIDLSQMAQDQFTLQSIVINQGTAPYEGSLCYALVDVQNQQRYRLPASETLQIGHQDYAFTPLRLSLSPEQLREIPIGRSYDIHILATLDGKDIEVWGNGLYRRRITLVNGVQNGISSSTTQMAINHDAQSQQLTLSGVRAGTPLQLRSLNGTLLWQSTMPTTPQAHFKLPALTHGIYVLRAGAHSHKLLQP